MPFTNNWFARALLVLGLAVPLLFGFAPLATAQEETAQEPTAEDQQAAEQAEKEGLVRLTEEVTVTGSLIPRKDLESLSPVSVLDPQEIQYQSTSRIEDLIQSLPQVFAAQNSTMSNNASGTASVDLRDLGSVRTLVLINGRRMPAGDVGSPAADLNFIPSALVQRVDVLTGGATTVYGADAVAGVVNFVLDTEFEGVRGGIQYTAFQHNNKNEVAASINEAKNFEYPTGSTWNDGGINVNLAVGGKFADGKGHASAYIDYREFSAITKDSRDYTNCSVSSSTSGPVCGGSGSWQYGYFATDTDDYVLDPRTGNTNTFRNRTSADVYNYGPLNYMQRPDTKWSGGGFARFTVNEHFEPYAEVMMMDDNTDAQIAPTANFFNTTSINCDNPMMSAQQRNLICTQNGYGPDEYAPLYVGRRNVEGGGRVSQISHASWRLLGGARGDINDAWSYDVYGIHSVVRSPQTSINDFHSNRIFEAMDVVGTPGQPSTWRCRSGNASCVPWNIFTNLGSQQPVDNIGDGVTQEALDFMYANALLDSGTSLWQLVGSVTADLEGYGMKLPSASEGIQLAFGGEYRREGLWQTPDEVSAQGLRSGSGGQTPFVDGYYDTNEFFVEGLIPLVQDTKGAQDLSLELGYRYSDYSNSGGNHSYKGQLAWAPVTGFKLRASYNRATRAPNAYELFQPQIYGLGGNEDICAGSNPTFTQAQCANTGVTAAQYGNVRENPADQYNSLDGGNPNLDVETADTYTFGVVWTPPSIPGLSITADYYTVDIEDTIGSLAPDDIVKACAETGDATLCSLIHRDRLGTLWLIEGEAFTESLNSNIGLLGVRGVDVTASYPWNLGGAGFINLSMIGSYMLENSYEDPIIQYDCIGFYGNQCNIPSADWRHRFRASWASNFNTTFTVGWRFITSVLNDDASDQPGLRNPGLVPRWEASGNLEIPAYNWFDVGVTYAFTDRLLLTAGVNNIFDKEPPLSAGTQDYAAGWYGTYDTLGRTIYTNFQFQF